MRKCVLLFVFGISSFFTFAQDSESWFSGTVELFSEKDVPKSMLDYYKINQNSGASISKGVVSNGSLKNGYLMPPFGDNFKYFDEDSYVEGRAFTNNKVYTTIIDAYAKLGESDPLRKFYLMELSNKEGGKMFPHRTHQNGMSCDFMMPLVKNGEPYYGLDTIGKEHYFLSFTDEGKYPEEKSIQVDFNLIAKHILLLNEAAKSNGLKVKKVIIKTEYKPYLFATEYGAKLEKSGIYVVQKLTPMINALHDDHYHIDFEEL